MGNFYESEELAQDLNDALNRCIIDEKLSMKMLAREVEVCFASHGFRDSEFRHGRKILVTRMDGLGDLVMTTPFLRELRRNEPHAHITLVVKPEYREVVELCPYINTVYCFDSSPGYLHGASKQFLDAIIAFSQLYLWTRTFDVCFVPRFDVDEFFDGFLCLMSGARQRFGFSEAVTPWKKLRTPGFDAIYNRTIPDLGYFHEVERSLSMISFLGGTVRSHRLELWTAIDDEEWAEFTLHSSPRPIIAVSMGQLSDRRCWPVERYAELLQWLSEKESCSYVLLGSKVEVELANTLSSMANLPVILNLAGKTTLRQMMALLKRCQLYIGRDTGTKHIAAAAGVPVVEISCHSREVPPAAIPSPARYGPWGVPHVVVQPEKATLPCVQSCSQNTAHCVLAVSVNQVKSGIMELIEKA